MQINNNGVANNTANSSANTQKASSSAKAENSSGAVVNESSDSVELSQAARVLTELEAKIATASDVDTARVESIRQAIANGSYTVNADSIASKMIASDEAF